METKNSRLYDELKYWAYSPSMHKEASYVLSAPTLLPHPPPPDKSSASIPAPLEFPPLTAVSILPSGLQHLSSSNPAVGSATDKNTRSNLS